MSTLTLGGVTLNVLSNQIDFGIPNPQTNQRVIQATIDLDGDNPTTLASSLAAILNQLLQASRGNRGVPLGPTTSLVWQASSGSPSVTFDLLPDNAGNFGRIEPTMASFSWLEAGYVPALKLTLNCTAYGRGTPVVATNLLLDSADDTTSNWTKTNTTATANAALAPNGDAVANSILETTTSGFHSLVQTVTKAATSITYCWSRYVKPNGRDFVDLTLQDGTGSNGVVAGYNVTTGAMSFSAAAFGSGFTAVDSGIVAANHGYYRCWLAVTVPASVTSFQAVMNIRQDGATTSYAGDITKGVYCWGATLQPNATTPGPYLQTGSSLTLTNGVDADMYLYDVPGDAPALPRITLSDVSTNGAVINDIRLGQQPVEFASDFQSVVTVTPASGTSQTDSDAVSANIASRAASPQWQTLGTFTKPSAAYTDGQLAVMGRVRDNSPAIGPPTGLTINNAGFAFLNPTIVNTTTAAASVAVAYTTPTDNNLMLAIVATLSATHTTPAGWTLAKSVSGTAGRISVFYKVAASEGTSTTFAFGSSTKSVISYVEVKGAATASVLDQTASASGTASVGTPITPTVPAITGTTPTTLQANELAIAAIVNDYAGAGGGGAGGIGSWSDGFALNATDLSGQGGVYGFGWVARALTATGTYATGYAVPGHGGDTYHYAGLIITLKGATSAAPSMPSATYTFRAAAVDGSGNVGPASTPVTINGSGAFTLNWTAPALIADPNHYIIYWERSGMATQSSTTADTSTTLTLLSESGSGALTPNTDTRVFGLYRMQLSLPSATTLIPAPAVQTNRANGDWELLEMGELPGTPEPSVWGGDALGWTVTVQMEHPSLGSTLAVDSLQLFPVNQPHAHWFFEDANGDRGGLATNRDWSYDLRPDGLASAVLYQTGTTTEAGRFLADSPFRVQPGAVVVCWSARIEGLVSTVTDAKVVMSLELTPQFLYLAS